MTKEELEQKEIELLSKYSTEAIQGYVDKISFHAGTDGESLKGMLNPEGGDITLDELLLHSEICQREIDRRSKEGAGDDPATVPAQG